MNKESFRASDLLDPEPVSDSKGLASVLVLKPIWERLKGSKHV
jgi:hypothetical protein